MHRDADWWYCWKSCLQKQYQHRSHIYRIHDQSNYPKIPKPYLNSMITGWDSLAPRLIPAAARAASSAPISLAVRNLACSVTGLWNQVDKQYSIRKVLKPVKWRIKWKDKSKDRYIWSIKLQRNLIRRKKKETRMIGRNELMKEGRKQASKQASKRRKAKKEVRKTER